MSCATAVAALVILMGLGGGDSGRGVGGKLTAHSRRSGRVVPSGPYAIDRAEFASGSCEAFPPTVGNLHTTVFLDAGHGGLDPGAIGTTTSGNAITEADETLPVELDAMALLRAKGYLVVVSRTVASTVLRLNSEDLSGQVLSLVGVHDDVAARDLCADDAKANVLVGIYYDAGSSSDDAGSITSYDPDRPFSSENLRLADLVQADILASVNAHGWAIPDDGVKSDSTLGSISGDPDSGGLAAMAANYGHLMLLGPAMNGYFTTPSSMTGVVTEPLFITDPFEGSLAASAVGQQAIAQGVASAIEQFLTQ